MTEYFPSTARHAQRTHLRQSACHPAGRLLPPTCWHGYVQKNKAADIKPLEGCSSLSSCLWIPKVSSCCCKPLMSSLLAEIGLWRGKLTFRLHQLSGAAWVWCPSLVWFTLQQPDWCSLRLIQPLLSFSASEPLTCAVAITAFRHTRENSSEECIPPHQSH